MKKLERLKKKAILNSAFEFFERFKNIYNNSDKKHLKLDLNEFFATSDEIK